MLKDTSKLLFTLILLFQSAIAIAQEPNDCGFSVIVCGDSDVVLDVSGQGGNSNEFPDSCSSNENNSLWLQVTVTTNGTLAFTLTPNSNNITEDYDFFIFGPNTTCNNLGPTIRCSTTNPQAAGQGNNLTGLSTTETDNFEGPGPDGNSFVSAINATAGDSYFIVIDRPIGNSPFSLEWTGTAQFAEAPVSDTDPVDPTDPTGNALNIIECDTVAPFNDNTTNFNLETNTPLIIGTQANIAVDYYLNESDANIGSNVITTPTAYTNTSNNQTIYATITNITTGCFTIQEFDLIVDPQPVINMPPDMELCDDGTNEFNLEAQTNTILGTQSILDFNVTYHETATDADTGTNALTSPFPIVTNPDEIFIRITPTSPNNNCYAFSATPFNLIVNPQPSITAIPDYGICDPDSDGFAEFNLPSQEAALVNGQANIAVTYFENQIDATNNTIANAIGNPSTFTNSIANMQEIFVSLEDTTSNCFSTTSFNIIAQGQPAVTIIADYSVCDTNVDGDDTNGFTLFDLTTQDAALINGQLGITVTYYENQADAIDNINPILNPTTFSNTTADMQVIFVRLDGGVANCFTTTQFNIVVDELPEVQNATLIQCDEDGTPDGFTEYNLNEANENVMVSGDTTGFIYTHHLNQADALGGINEVTPFPFTNTVNPQTIYVRIENATTGCFRTAEYVLDVTATDIGNAGLSECDGGIDGYDGITEFTLSDADATILAALPPGLNVDYYATANDAQLEINQLPNLYTNTTPFLQTIFIRVENANECFGIANMDLTVNPLPQNNTVNDFEVCSDIPDEATLDLSQFDAEVLGTQNPLAYTISYYETQFNADNNINPITGLYTNTNNPQNIVVKVEDNTTACEITTINFNITVNNNPTNLFWFLIYLL